MAAVAAILSERPSEVDQGSIWWESPEERHLERLLDVAHQVILILIGIRVVQVVRYLVDDADLTDTRQLSSWLISIFCPGRSHPCPCGKFFVQQYLDVR